MTKRQDEFYERVARLAFENACDLNTEARLLFDNGHYARAIALSVTSMEELVKAATYILASIGEQNGIAELINQSSISPNDEIARR